MSAIHSSHTRQSGFSVFLVLGIVVVVAIIGVSLLVSSLRKQADTATRQEQKATQNTHTTKTPSPNDYATYSSAALGFSFAYPKAWGALTVTGDGSMAPAVGSTTELKNNTDFPFHQGALTFSINTRSNYSITGQKHGATYVPVLKNTTYNNYVWKVVAVDPADITDKIGDLYSATLITSATGAQLYDFNYNDGQANIKRWAFETKAGFVTLAMPAYGPAGGPGGIIPSAADDAAQQAIANTIAKSIQLIY